MTLWLHVHCGYPSYEQSGTKWNTWDYDGSNFAKALKGEPFNGYSTIKAPNGSWKRITAQSPQAAFDIFGAWGAKVMLEAGIETAYIIPVPGSKCVEFDTDAKGRKLCAAIAAHFPNAIADEAFHWTEVLVPAHKGGPRSKHQLLPKLVLWDALPTDRPIVLVDDVATLHGHLKTCAQKLRDSGHQVALALAGAQTVHERPDHHMFAFPPVDIDAAPASAFENW